MNPAAVAFHVVSYVISVLAPIALFVVALVVVRKGAREGWAWIATGAGIQFVTATAGPAANYAVTFWAGRQGVEALRDTMTLTAGIGLACTILSAIGLGLVILGIIRLARLKPDPAPQS
jgi:hypothetical protein